MANVRETVVSNCEKNFVLQCFAENKRLDGRDFDQFRNLSIKFGVDWGDCYVSLGKTSVLAAVTCEIQPPKSARPNEGMLNINIELGSLGGIDSTTQQELSVQLNRTLEKCIKESKAIDLESLCIKTDAKVWEFRVQINVLNHEGNIIDCASVAALAALAHFRRPDVTTTGEEIIVHSYAQRDPIPTVIHHYPINISEFVVADPTLLEEGIAEAHLTLSCNAYRELCGLHLGGNAEMSPKTILQCANKAADRAKEIVDQINNCLQEDWKLRERNAHVGFSADGLFDDLDTSAADLEACLDLWTKQKSKKARSKKSKKGEETVESKWQETGTVESLGKGTAELMPSTGDWIPSTDDESEEPDVMVVEEAPHHTMMEVADSNSGSEEEAVIVINADKETKKKRRAHR